MKRLGGPYPAKSQYFCLVRFTEEAAKIATTGNTLNHEAEARKLGGHIGSPQTRDSWITTQVNGSAHGVTALGNIAKRFPQTAYAGLVKALQNEWTYLQRVTTGHGSLYEPIKKAIREYFLPTLLDQTNIGEKMRNYIVLAVNRDGLGIPDPTRSTADNYTASVDCCKLLVESLLTRVPPDIWDHQRHAINRHKR